MDKKKFVRGFLSLLGAILILWSIGLILLGFIGSREPAVITGIRKQGGERNESTPGRYTYVISYKFKIENGRYIEGFTYKIGNYTKIYNFSSDTAYVRYLKVFPFFNALEQDTSPSLIHFILMVVGGLLLYLNLKSPRYNKFKTLQA